VALEVITTNFQDQDLSPERESEINDLLTKAMSLLEVEVATPGQVDPQSI